MARGTLCFTRVYLRSLERAPAAPAWQVCALVDCAGYALFYPRLSFAVWSVRTQHLQKQACALVDFRYLLLFSRVGFPSSTFLSSRTNNTTPPRSGRHASPKAHFTTKVGTPRVPAHACYNKPNLRTPKRLCKRACLRFLMNEGGSL